VPVARRRSRHSVGGVLTGIADAHHIEIRLIRTVVILAAVFFPPTLALYVLAWILLPEAPGRGVSPAELFSGKSRNWLVVVVVIVALLTISDGPWGWGAGRRGNLVGAVLLIGLGAWLWSQHGRDRGAALAGGPWSGDVGTGSRSWSHDATVNAGAATGVSGQATGESVWDATSVPASAPPGGGGWPETDTTRSGWDTTGTGWDPPGTGWESTYPWMTTLPPSSPPAPIPAGPPPPPVGRVTVAIALLTLGLAFAGDRLGWYRLDASAAFALLLGVAGLGIIAGAFIGGGRLLVLPALVLLPLTIVTACIGPIHFTGGIGERTVRPLSAADAARGYHHGIGQLTVDLRRLPTTSAVPPIPVRLGIGEVRVLVPSDAHVLVKVHVGAGVVDVFEERADGSGVNQSYECRLSDATRTINLDVQDGIGHVQVQRDPGGAPCHP
jgi:phage shock protein PspC (stress-responsive transcriptional regulator)